MGSKGLGGKPRSPLALPAGQEAAEDRGLEAHEAALRDGRRRLPAVLELPEAQECDVFHDVVWRHQEHCLAADKVEECFRNVSVCQCICESVKVSE